MENIKDFSLGKNSVIKIHNFQAKICDDENSIKNLAENAKEYARHIIVKIANHPDEFNKLSTFEKFNRGSMMVNMRSIVKGDCFALGDFSEKEFYSLKLCVENTVKNKKDWNKNQLKILFEQILKPEAIYHYKKISFSKTEMNLMSKILIENNFLYLSDKLLDKKRIDIQLESDTKLNFTTKKIDTAKKYSVGNCTEISLIAMEYIAMYDAKISAELFQIEGGDHLFLVINRDQKSDPHDPSTWGNLAYICDPWANKVYQAKEYRSQLKNFENLISKVELKAFNPKKHKVSPCGVDAELLRGAYSEKHLFQLVENFNKKLVKFLDAFEQLNTHSIFKTVSCTEFHQKIAQTIIDIKSNMIEDATDYVEKNCDKGYMRFKERLEDILFKFQKLHTKAFDFVENIHNKVNTKKNNQKHSFFSNSKESESQRKIDKSFFDYKK